MDNEKDYEMTDHELINLLAEERMAQLAEIEARNDEDYEIDPEVWQRLIDVTEYLCKLVAWFGGEVKPCEAISKSQTSASRQRKSEWSALTVRKRRSFST